MALPDKAKPATADTVNGLRNFEQLAGRLEIEATPAILRAQRLSRFFALPNDTAATIARLAYGEVAS
jgi:hypothetical protein